VTVPFKIKTPAENRWLQAALPEHYQCSSCLGVSSPPAWNVTSLRDSRFLPHYSLVDSNDRGVHLEYRSTGPVPRNASLCISHSLDTACYLVSSGFFMSVSMCVPWLRLLGWYSYDITIIPLVCCDQTYSDGNRMPPGIPRVSDNRLHSGSIRQSRRL
jgi:hypothetical protein